MNSDAYIIDAVRTPIGRVGGSMATLEVQDLLAPLIQALVKRNQLEPTSIDEVIIGNAAGPGGNPARLALLQAGLPVSVPGFTVDRQCGSGLEAINLGVRLVQSGAVRTVLAGGVESASTAPLRATVHGARQCPPQFYSRPRFAPAEIGDPDMGEAAENVALRYGVSRRRQDEFALLSHAKTQAALALGRFDREIIPIPVANGVIRRDECPRTDTSIEKLAALKPVFKEKGTVTAANACPVNDGAALVLISCERLLHGDMSVRPSVAMRLLESCAAGVEPNFLGTGPVPAVQAVLSRSGLVITELSQIEFNEAFAAQVLACVDLLNISEPQLNPAGGALALGHPYAASGAVLVTRLLHDLDPNTFGLATLGIGGGLGLASLFEAVS